MLTNLVNGLYALASGTLRKKEDSLGGKLSEGRVSFEDALAHIYPESAPGAQARTQTILPTPASTNKHTGGVQVESVTIYDAFKGYAPLNPQEESVIAYVSMVESPALAPTDATAATEPAWFINECSVESQKDTYDNLPILKMPNPRQTSQLPAYTAEQLEKTLQMPVQSALQLPDPEVSQVQKTLPLPQQAAGSIAPFEKTLELPVQEQQWRVKAPELAQQNFEPNSNEFAFEQTAKTFENLSLIQADLAQQILSNYTETVSPVRRDFLDYMTAASSEFLTERNRPAEPVCVPTSMSSSMRALVDRIFNTIEPYVHELNQTFRATDLSVTFTPPSVVNENVGVDSLRRPAVTVSSYRCRISTSCLALVIRGKEDRIDFFLLPVEKVMGLSKVEDEHQPLMTFTAYARSGVINWEVEQKPLTEERMEKYILLIFEHLLELTREELLKRPAYAGSF